MESNGSDGFGVVFQSGVWLVAQIQVKPVELSIVRTGDDVVSSWVDVEARVPLDTGHQLLDHRLCKQDAT